LEEVGRCGEVIIRRLFAAQDIFSESHALQAAFSPFSELSKKFIKSARKPRAFKPGDEWPPGATPHFCGGAEEFQA